MLQYSTERCRAMSLNCFVHILEESLSGKAGGLFFTAIIASAYIPEWV